MNTYNFNLRQTLLFSKYKLNLNTKNYHQIVSLNYSLDLSIITNIYISLIKCFPILRSIISINENNYSINDISNDKITIIKTNDSEKSAIVYDFDFNKYLFVIFYSDNKLTLLLNHLFIDGKSLQLIYDFIKNNNFSENPIIESKIDTIRYYDYNFNYPEIKLDSDNLNLNLVKPHNGENYKSNSYFIINDLFLNDITEYCSEIGISSHTFYFGLFTLILKNLGDNTDDFVIYDIFHGRPSEYKDTIGFFSFPSPILIKKDFMDRNIVDYFKKVQESIKQTIGSYKKNNFYIAINDCRKLPFFKESVISQGNNDTNCNLVIKILDYNYFLIQYKSVDIEIVDQIKSLTEWFIKLILQKRDLLIDEINEIEFITEKDDKILTEFNNTDMDKWPKNDTIILLFEKMVNKYPNNIALIHNDIKLTYDQLNKEANKLSRKIKESPYFRENSIICICLERSNSMIISMLAILKSGCAYCPIDINYPNDLKQYIISDTKASVIISFDNLGDHTIIPDNYDIYSDTNLGLYILTDDYASIIYTSGTTGKPKGVIICHRAIINLTYWYDSIHNLTVFGLSGNYIFVATIRMIFAALLFNKILVLLPSLQDKTECINTIIKYNVESLSFSPNILLLYMDDLISMNRSMNIHTGGEQVNLKNNMIEFFNNSDKYNLYNCYGSTEICAVVTYTKIKNNGSIGKPINNMKIYVLNNNLNRVPIGIIGDIYISGIQLSEGYLNQSKLTDRAFIMHSKYGRIYKSGDIGRINSDGELEYLGRNDFQIKLNGIRIELEQIDSNLIELSEIESCITLFVNNKIISYVVTSLSINEIIGYLKTKLPSYMIPIKIIKLEEIKLTPRGKIDRIYLESLYIEDTTKIYDFKNINDNICLLLKNHNLVDNVHDCDIPLINYGLDSMKYIQMINILNSTFNYNFDMKLFADCSINDIINSIKISKTDKFSCCKLFKNKNYIDTPNLLIIFKDGYNNFPNLLSDKPIDILFNFNTDILSVTNPRAIPKHKFYDLCYFNEIMETIKNYKRINILTDCAGCMGALYFSNIADKIIIDSGNFNDSAHRYIKNNKIVLNIILDNIKNKNDDMYFIVNGKYDYNQLNFLKNKIELKNVIVNPFNDPIEKHLVIRPYNVDIYLKYIRNIFNL